MDLQTAKIDLLYDASRNDGHIYLINRSEGRHVKGFAVPADWRDIYVAALEALAREGFVKTLFKNRELHLYLTTAVAPLVPSLESAKARILEEIESNRFVYKIHSGNGEYVQCSNENFEKFENIRIIYLRALSELLRRGTIDVQKESKDLCVYITAKRPDAPEEFTESMRLELESEQSIGSDELELCA